MFLMLIPLILNVIAVWKSSVVLTAVSMAAIPAVVALLPDARHHENMFLFFVATISLIPTNLQVMHMICESGFLEGSFHLSAVCMKILFYWILFNCEHICLGFAGRLIWPRQYRLFHIKATENE